MAQMPAWGLGEARAVGMEEQDSLKNHVLPCVCLDICLGRFHPIKWV